jgi:cyclophilin family peptidyl-prolyl cis-trans isomerase
MSPSSNRKVKPSTAKSRNRNKNRAIIGIIALAAIVIVAYVMLGQANSVFSNPSPSATPTASPTSTPIPTATPLTSPVGEYSANGTQVLFETSKGNFIIQLRDDKPITTTNFVNLVIHRIYDGTLFHRVIADFMIQGGVNETANLSTISDEIGTDNHNYIGTIAMAKTSLPNSATSSFFINVDDNSQIVYSDGTSFDGTYTVFGKVVSGMDVVNAISNVSVGNNAYGEKSEPLTDITLIKATILN